MRSAENQRKVDKIWNLVKHEHAAVLVSIRKDGSLDSFPMGCVQSDFDGRLWFLTFRDNPRLHEIEKNGQWAGFLCPAVTIRIRFNEWMRPNRGRPREGSRALARRVHRMVSRWSGVAAHCAYSNRREDCQVLEQTGLIPDLCLPLCASEADRKIPRLPSRSPKKS